MELHRFHSTPIYLRKVKIRKNKISSAIGTCGGWRGEERRGTYRVLVEKFEEWRQLGKHRCRWENIIKMVLKEIGWWYARTIDLAQFRGRQRIFAGTVMNLRFFIKCEKFLDSLRKDSDLWR